MEKNDFICVKHKGQKDISRTCLDSVCTNLKCSNFGPICSLCIPGSHDHQISEILSLPEFLKKNGLNFEYIKARSDPQSLEIRYRNIKMQIEELKKSFEDQFKKIVRSLNSAYGELLLNDFYTEKEVTQDRDIVRSENFRKNIIDVIKKVFLSKAGLEKEFHSINTIEKTIAKFDQFLKELNNIDVKIPEHQCANLENFIDPPKVKQNLQPKEGSLKPIEHLHQLGNMIKNVQNIDKPLPLQKIDGKKNILKKDLGDLDPIQKKVKPDTKTNGVSISSESDVFELRRLEDSEKTETMCAIAINAITFKSEFEIVLEGFGQYKPKDANVKACFEYVLLKGKHYDDANPSAKICEGSIDLERSNNSKIELIRFREPVRILQNEYYTLKIINKTKNKEFNCYTGVRGVEKKDFISFFRSEKMSKGKYNSNVFEGQIPLFLFKKKLNNF